MYFGTMAMGKKLGLGDAKRDCHLILEVFCDYYLFVSIKKSLFFLSLTLYLLHEGHYGQMRNQCRLKYYKSEMKKI